MSNLVSALPGAAYEGYVRVEEMGLRGMITLRGDLASADVKNAATGVAGVDMPGQREINTVGAKAGDVAISKHVIQFKAELERVREQVQNVE